MALGQDAQAVYEAIQERSPQEPDDLPRSSGVHGECLERALEHLEDIGLALRGYETGRPAASGYSFDWAQLP